LSKKLLREIEDRNPEKVGSYVHGLQNSKFCKIKKACPEK